MPTRPSTKKSESDADARRIADLETQLSEFKAKLDLSQQQLATQGDRLSSLLLGAEERAKPASTAAEDRARLAVTEAYEKFARATQAALYWKDQAQKSRTIASRHNETLHVASGDMTILRKLLEDAGIAWRPSLDASRQERAHQAARVRDTLQPATGSNISPQTRPGGATFLPSSTPSQMTANPAALVGNPANRRLAPNQAKFLAPRPYNNSSPANSAAAPTSGRLQVPLDIDAPHTLPEIPNPKLHASLGSLEKDASALKLETARYHSRLRMKAALEKGMRYYSARDWRQLRADVVQKAATLLLTAD